VGSAGDGEKSEKREMFSMAKYQHNNQPIHLKITAFTSRIDCEDDAAVFGYGGGLDQSAAMDGDGQVKFAGESSRERGGKAHLKQRNNQPLTLILSTVLASRVEAIVRGSLLL
jgi:hypothetical protein